MGVKRKDGESWADFKARQKADAAHTKFHRTHGYVAHRDGTYVKADEERKRKERIAKEIGEWRDRICMAFVFWVVLRSDVIAVYEMEGKIRKASV